MDNNDNKTKSTFSKVINVVREYVFVYMYIWNNIKKRKEKNVVLENEKKNKLRNIMGYWKTSWRSFLVEWKNLIVVNKEKRDLLGSCEDIWADNIQ